jgi:hypothetical protein
MHYVKSLNARKQCDEVEQVMVHRLTFCDLTDLIDESIDLSIGAFRTQPFLTIDLFALISPSFGENMF